MLGKIVQSVFNTKSLQAAYNIFNSLFAPANIYEGKHSLASAPASISVFGVVGEANKHLNACK